MLLPSIKRALLVSAVAATAVVGASALPAQAVNPGCGSHCNNENPNTFNITPPGGPSQWYHCSADAKTVDSLGPADNRTLRDFGVTLQLRYSPKCRTTWARAYGLSNTDTLVVKVYGAGGSQWTSNDTEYGQNASYQSGPGQMWSPMMNDAGYTSRACFTPRAHGSTRLQVCTEHPA